MIYTWNCTVALIGILLTAIPLHRAMGDSLNIGIAGVQEGVYAEAAYKLATRRARRLRDVYGTQIDITYLPGCEGRNLTEYLTSSNPTAIIGFNCGIAFRTIQNLIDRKDTAVSLGVVSGTETWTPNVPGFRFAAPFNTLEEKAAQCAYQTFNPNRILLVRGHTATAPSVWQHYFANLSIPIDETDVSSFNSQSNFPTQLAEHYDVIYFYGIGKNESLSVPQFHPNLGPSPPAMFLQTSSANEGAWTQFQLTETEFFYAGSVNPRLIAPPASDYQSDIQSISEEVENAYLSLPAWVWNIGLAVEAIVVAAHNADLQPNELLADMRSKPIPTPLTSLTFSEEGEIAGGFFAVYSRVNKREKILLDCSAELNPPDDWPPSTENLVSTIVQVPEPLVSPDPLTAPSQEEPEAPRFPISSGSTALADLARIVSNQSIVDATSVSQLHTLIESHRSELTADVAFSDRLFDDLHNTAQSLFDASPDIAVKVWEIAAQYQHVPSLLSVVLAHRDGSGVEQNKRMAAKISNHTYRVGRMRVGHNPVRDRRLAREAKGVHSALVAECQREQNHWCTEATVLYVTNRALQQSQENRIRFGTTREQNGVLHFGQSIVAIDEARVPIDQRNIVDVVRDFLMQAEPVEVMRNAELSEDEFFSFFDGLQDSVLLFLHGIGNSFHDAAETAAEFAHRMEFRGITMIFSWPSSGEPIKSRAGYLAEEERQKLSCRSLMSVLSMLSTDIVEERQLMVIAHSMGGELLVSALTSCPSSLSRYLGKPIYEVVLAAPDIPTSVFRQGASDFAANAKRITLYASSEDIALKFASGIRLGYHRLGLGGEGRVILPQVETVDASTAPAPGDYWNHSYVFLSPPVVHDVGEILHHATHPDYRMWPIRMNDGESTYWEITGASSNSETPRMD